MGAAFKEYANYDALGLAELIAAKTVSPQEVLEAALYRIYRVYPRKLGHACWKTTSPQAPAMSVPMGFSSSGLPIGAQFTAAYGREDVLLALATQIEQAHPWRHHRAPIWG